MIKIILDKKKCNAKWEIIDNQRYLTIDYYIGPNREKAINKGKYYWALAKSAAINSKKIKNMHMGNKVGKDIRYFFAIPESEVKPSFVKIIKESFKGEMTGGKKLKKLTKKQKKRLAFLKNKLKEKEHKDNPTILQEIAGIYNHTNPELALEWMKKAAKNIHKIQYEGQHIALIFSLAQLYGHLKYFNDAFEQFDKLKKLLKKPNTEYPVRKEKMLEKMKNFVIPASTDLAKKSILAKEYKIAIAYLSRGIKILEPDKSPKLYHMRGGLYLEQNNFNQSIKDFQECIALNPNHGLAYTDLGRTYYEVKKYSLAKINIDKALKLDPNNAQALQNKKLLLEKEEGNTTKIRHVLSKAIQVSEHYSVSFQRDLCNSRLSCLFSEKKYKEAVGFLQEILQNKSNILLESDCYYLMSYAYQEMQQYKIALKHIINAININHKEPVYHFQKMMIHILLRENIDENKEFILFKKCLTKKGKELHARASTISQEDDKIFQELKKYQNEIKIFESYVSNFQPRVQGKIKRKPSENFKKNKQTFQFEFDQKFKKRSPKEFKFIQNLFLENRLNFVSRMRERGIVKLSKSDARRQFGNGTKAFFAFKDPGNKKRIPVEKSTDENGTKFIIGKK